MTHPSDCALVWDASPLVHAARADRLDVVGDLVAYRNGPNLLTAAVVEDLRNQGVDRHVADAGWLTVADEPDDTGHLDALVRFQQRLGVHGSAHLGEATVLALTAHLDAVAVIDEKAARSIAVAESIRHIGILGLIDDGVLLGRHTMAAASSLVGTLVGTGAFLPELAVADFPSWSRTRRERLGLPLGRP